MRIFISHQRSDSALAAEIATRLRNVHYVDCYVDVIDPAIVRGEDLADHIRLRMSECTQLLALISYSTQESQWVPWEIGVATEKDYPLATYTSTMSRPPEFLRKWPYLRNNAELDLYVRASKSADELRSRYRSTGTREGPRLATKEFYRTLRSSLGQ